MRAVQISLLLALTAGPALAGSFVDQRGKTLTFDAAASRVVTIAIPQFWIYIAVDGTPTRIIGANPTAIAQMKPSLLSKMYPSAVDVPTAIVRGGTFTPNIEELLRIKPDVVYQWADRGDDLITSLEAVNLKTVGVKNTGSETDFDKWVTMMGETSFKQDRVAQMLKDRQAMVTRLADTITGIPDSEKPRVLAMQQYSKALNVEGANGYLDLFIKRAGGVNVGAQVALGPGGYAQVNLEQVIAWKPDVIILSQFEDKTPADMYSDPLWSTVPAVKNKRVYKQPFGGSRWGGADQETPLFWIWLADLQNPGKFKVDLVAEMKRQYRFLYNYDLTSADIDNVLQRNQNGVSTNYDQFIAK